MKQKLYKIFKGCHYSNFIPSIKCLNKRITLSKTFVFTGSCRYHIKEIACVNKLFGISIGLFGVHKTSFRFGWVYNSTTQKIDIYQYQYKFGLLQKTKVHEVSIGESVKYEIVVDPSRLTGITYIFYYINDNKVGSDYIHLTKKLGLTLGPYFGGNTKAPHKVEIQELIN